MYLMIIVTLLLCVFSGFLYISFSCCMQPKLVGTMITSRKIPASTAKEGLNAQSPDNQRFRGTSVTLLKKTSCETKKAEKGTSDPKNLSLSMQRESTQANARPEKPKIASPKTFCKPALHELLTTSMNANDHRNSKVRFGSPSTGNVATLNAPSSPAHCNGHKTVASQSLLRSTNVSDAVKGTPRDDNTPLPQLKAAKITKAGTISSKSGLFLEKELMEVSGRNGSPVTTSNNPKSYGEGKSVLPSPSIMQKISQESDSDPKSAAMLKRVMRSQAVRLGHKQQDACTLRPTHLTSSSPARMDQNKVDILSTDTHEEKSNETHSSKAKGTSGPKKISSLMQRDRKVKPSSLNETGSSLLPKSAIMKSSRPPQLTSETALNQLRGAPPSTEQKRTTTMNGKDQTVATTTQSLTRTKAYSSEQIEEILANWIFNPNYSLPTNVHPVDLYMKDSFEDLEKYSEGGYAYFVFELVSKGGKFNRKMADRTYSWTQSKAYYGEKSIRKVMKYSKKLPGVPLETMKNRRMDEYTIQNGPQHKVLCEIFSNEWWKEDSPVSTSHTRDLLNLRAQFQQDLQQEDVPEKSLHTLPQIQMKELQNLRAQFQQDLQQEDVPERSSHTLLQIQMKELQNLRAEFQQENSAQRQKIKALELELASAKKKSKASSDLMKENEKLKRMLNDVQLRLLEAEKQHVAVKKLQKKLNTIEVKGNIKVICRVRPLFSNESCAVHYPKSGEGRDIEFTHKGQMHSYKLDKVFDQSASQEDVFVHISGLVQSVVEGCKVTIFSYGQIGSGKTYTMIGDLESDEQKGIIPRSFDLIFQKKQALASEGWQISMEVLMFEIYNETVRDLVHLNPTSTSKLSDVTTIAVSNTQDVYDLLTQAYKRRCVAKTEMNDHSSRSHTVFMLRVCGRNEKTCEQVEGFLTLVDLAGSEHANQNCSKQREKEALAINTSLFWLGNVLFSIAKQEKYVDFRSSKLTHILQPYLQQNSKIVMVVNVSPDIKSSSESIRSLDSAARFNLCEIAPSSAYKSICKTNTSVYATIRKGRKRIPELHPCPPSKRMVPEEHPVT